MTTWVFDAEIWDRATGARGHMFNIRVSAHTWFIARAEALCVVARQPFELWNLGWWKVDD